MTVQEAIKKLKTMPVAMFDDEADLSKRIAIKCMEEVEQYRALGTVEELKEAREKQIPKKPIENDTSYSGYKCPTCNSNIYQLRSHNIMQTPHCIFCGQALKWGEEDD